MGAGIIALLVIYVSAALIYELVYQWRNRNGN